MKPYELSKGKILEVYKENETTLTIHIELEDSINAKPGQFVMFYAFGRGEAPITIASMEDNTMINTIRIVGRVTTFFKNLKKRDTVHFRGPYGNVWPKEKAYFKDLIIISGGLGLAATRWILEEIIKERENFNNIISIYGSKSFDDLLYDDMYNKWQEKINFYITLDKPDDRWNGKIGNVLDVIKDLDIKKDSVVFICGPDPMVKACINELRNFAIKESNMIVSLERHMKCAVGTCGHCMIGPLFVCKNGPIFNYETIKMFYEKRGV